MPLNFPKTVKHTYQKGKWAEGYAYFILLLKGYRVLARRWQTPVGEIDIIARRKDVLVAIEVKYRTTIAQAVQAVTFRQRQRIGNALQVWLKSKKTSHAYIRFDVMVVSKLGRAHHIKNAWHL